jgi:hypothetical protein
MAEAGGFWSTSSYCAWSSFGHYLLRKGKVMGKAHAILTCGMVMGLVLMSMWVDCSPRPAFEPSSEKVEATYHGQPTSFWLAQLQSRDIAFRVMATQALEQIGSKDEHVVPALAAMLEDPSKEVRRAAAFALRRLGSEVRAAVPSLLLALRDRDHLVRINAACALVSIHPQDESIRAALRAMIEDDSPAVRGAILRILRAMGPAATAASPAVREALRDTHACRLHVGVSGHKEAGKE